MKKFLLSTIFLSTVLLTSQTHAQEKMPSRYVGSSACRECHDVETVAEPKPPHLSLQCENCHGPGLDHAGENSEHQGDPEFIKGPSKINCMDCHKNSPTVSAFPISAHARERMTCNDCHVVTIHSQPEEVGNRDPQAQRKFLRKSVPALCKDSGCHNALINAHDSIGSRNRATALSVPHSSVAANQPNCTNCHNPHEKAQSGSFGLRNAFTSTCSKCHPTITIPVAIEHLAIQDEGCLSCHAMHMANSGGMLKIDFDDHELCMTCHANDGIQSNHGQGKSCGTGGCHPTFHGSHFKARFRR